MPLMRVEQVINMTHVTTYRCGHDVCDTIPQYCVPEDNRCYYCKDISDLCFTTRLNFPKQCTRFCKAFLDNQAKTDFVGNQITENLPQNNEVLSTAFFIAFLIAVVVLSVAAVLVFLKRRRLSKSKPEHGVEKIEEQTELMETGKTAGNVCAESQTEAGDGAGDTDTTTLCQAVPNGNIHCSSDEEEGEDVDANRHLYRRSSGSVLSQEISETDEDHRVGQNSRNRNRNTADKTIAVDGDIVITIHNKNKHIPNGSGLPNELKTVIPSDDKEWEKAEKQYS